MNFQHYSHWCKQSLHHTVWAPSTVRTVRIIQFERHLILFKLNLPLVAHWTCSQSTHSTIFPSYWHVKVCILFTAVPTVPTLRSHGRKRGLTISPGMQWPWLYSFLFISYSFFCATMEANFLPNFLTFDAVWSHSVFFLRFPPDDIWCVRRN